MKNKERTILCMIIATVFLIPLIGNTAVAATTEYYFGSYDWMIAWDTNPWNMADGDPDTYASTSIDGDVELLYGPVTSGIAPGNITMVEIRAKGYYTGGQQGYINLTPVFRFGNGDTYTFTPPQNSGGWSDWFDITDDPNAPEPWTGDDVVTLKCEVEAYIPDPAGLNCTLHCSIVEICVTWT